MKRILQLLCAALALLLIFTAVPALAISSYAEDNPVVLTAESVSGTKGETVTVPLRISGVSSVGINGFQFRMTYDAEMLRAESAVINRPGDYKVINYGEGFVEFMWTSLNANKKNNVIAEVTFTLLKAGESAVTAALDPEAGDCVYYLSGEEMIDLPVNTVPGIVSAAADPENDFAFVLTAPDTPVNEQVRLDISMINAPKAYGFSLEINFDPDKLAFVSGSFASAFPYGRAVCNEPGKARVFAATEYYGPVTGDSGMAELIFDVIDPDKAEGSVYDFTISFYNEFPSYTLDDNGRTVKLTDVYCFNTSVTLTAAVITADPYDLNRDLTCDINDVGSLLNYLSGVADALPDDVDPDLNGDAAVTIEDVGTLLNHLAS